MVTVVSRSTSRSTTTAYRPSLPPKCSYTTGLETPAWAAISSIEVPSNPRSANSRLPMSSSCCRRSWPVIRFLLGLGGLFGHRNIMAYAAALPAWSAGFAAFSLRIVMLPRLRVAFAARLAFSRASSGQRTS